MRARVLLAVAIFLTPLAVDTIARARPTVTAPNVFQLLTGYSAKESCSCAFVVEQTDAYCQEFGKVTGYDVTVSIDRGAKTVTSTFVTTTRTARFADGAGCTLDPLP